jgi:predicted nucleic acid-binding protein
MMNKMRVITLDANFLINHVSNDQSDDNKHRADHLLNSPDTKFIIPMPTFAEFLIRANHDGMAWINALEKKKSVIFAPFDKAAAIECSLLDGAALGRGDKRDGVDAPYQKIKIDRQIVAIAKAHQTTEIITSDSGIQTAANRVFIKVKTIEDYPLPDNVINRPIFP